MLEKIICIVIALYIVFKLLEYMNYHIHRTDKNLEGMEGIGIEVADERKKYTYIRGVDLYDDFYSKIYDNLLVSSHKDKYIIKQLTEGNIKLNNSSSILDIGCGTGNIVNELHNSGIANTVGLDISKSMITQARQKYPDKTFITGDALNRVLFPPNMFSHILCDYFTYYYFSNKHLFFKNCYYWLRPDSYLIIHLVDKYRFDPVVPSANPLYLVNAQKYAKKRITKSKVAFYGYDYSSQFIVDDSKTKDVSIFKETFKNKKSGAIREQEHILYLEPIEVTMDIATSEGFIYKSRIDLLQVQYEYQYIYIFHKPK
jgi:ubiquinone/menaquinone biosynthesis C-methylase UbiE